MERIEQWMARVDWRRWGGVGGLLYGAAFLGAFALRAAVYSSAHLNLLQNDLTKPERVLPAVARQPIGFIAIAGMDLLLGMAVLLLVLALYQRLAPLGRTLTRPAAAVGLLSAGLFVALGLFGMIRLPQIAADYARHAAAASAAYRAYVATDDVLLSLATAALGAWLVVTCWAAIRARVFARTLNWLGLIWGALALLSPIEDASFLLLGQLLGLTWAVWLGVILLLRPSERAASGANTPSAAPEGEPSSPAPPPVSPVTPTRPQETGAGPDAPSDPESLDS